MKWMLTSIDFLLEKKDFYGAFVMCLNTIEPLAGQRYLKLKSGERFRKFLHEERQPYIDIKSIYLPPADAIEPPPFPKLDDFDDDIDEWEDAVEEWEEAFDELSVSGKNLISLEQVLWKYCRNPIVHEGARLTVDDTYVTLDWSRPPDKLCIQAEEGVLVIGALFLLNVLYQIVSKHLK